jgi:ABC-type branched-subunit amino acid transport system substrate-binding protein
VRKIGKFGLVFLALAALLLVLAAACGGGEEKKGTPTATPPAATATRTAVATATRTAVATATRTAVPTATPTAAATAAATPTAAPTTAPTPEATPTPVVENIKGITDTEIVLGTHFAQTGTYGAAFAPVLAGMKAYFKYINAEEGGVCGRQIVLKAEDDGYDPANSPGIVRKLVEQDEVFAIVAGLGTAAHSAVWEYLNEKGIPDLWIMSGAHKWTADPVAHPWSVAILPDYYVEGTIVGKYISANLPGKKVGVLYQNDDFGKDELAGVKNGLDPTKNELVSEQSFEVTTVDIRSQVNNLRNAGAEVVHGACIPGHCAQAIKAADQMGWDVQFFIGYVNSDPAMFTYAGGAEVMEGVMTMQGNKMYDWTDDPAVAEHHRIMSEYSDGTPGNFTVVGQEAGELTVAALRATCDNLTREGLMNAVNTIFKDYQGALNLPGVTTTLSPTDHLATEALRMLKATVTPEGKGKWEYFGDIIQFR